jgi:hypothetical protein
MSSEKITKEQALQKKLNLIVEQNLTDFGCEYVSSNTTWKILNVLEDTLYVYEKGKFKNDSFRGWNKNFCIGKPITLQLI